MTVECSCLCVGESTLDDDGVSRYVFSKMIRGQQALTPLNKQNNNCLGEGQSTITVQNNNKRVSKIPTNNNIF